MTEHIPSDEKLDERLRSALAERPEADISSNLAMRVIERARQEVRSAHVVRTRQPTIIESLVWAIATLCVVVVFTIGVLRVLAIKAAASALFSASSSDTGSSSDEVGTMLLVGFAGLAMACIYLAVQSAYASDGERLTSIGTMD